MTVVVKELHVCMGLNACAQHDVDGTAVMAGTGQCSTVSHYCHGLNDCRGQGFCGGGGSTGAEQTQPGNNLCAGKGSCNTLATLPNYTSGPQWYMNQTAPPNPPVGPTVPPPGPYYGQRVWQIARQLFETRMYESGRTFVPDGKTIPPNLKVTDCFGSSPQPEGPNPPQTGT